MRDFIPIAKPIIGDEEIKAVGDVLKSGMLAQGESVKRFEDEFSSYLGVKNSIAVNNGTVALDLAIKALGLKPGDEVITPAFTFIATANCALYQGLRPVFADVDPRTFNIDPEDLQKKITPRTRAVIGVHLYGQPFDLSAVSEICQDRGNCPGRGLRSGPRSGISRQEGGLIWYRLLLLLPHQEHDHRRGGHDHHQ